MLKYTRMSSSSRTNAGVQVRPAQPSGLKCWKSYQSKKHVCLKYCTWTGSSLYTWSGGVYKASDSEGLERRSENHGCSFPRPYSWTTKFTSRVLEKKHFVKNIYRVEDSQHEIPNAGYLHYYQKWTFRIAANHFFRYIYIYIWDHWSDGQEFVSNFQTIYVRLQRLLNRSRNCFLA